MITALIVYASLVLTSGKLSMFAICMPISSIHPCSYKLLSVIQ